MKQREPEPLEQIDYGQNYKARGSSSQSMVLKVDGGSIAIAISVAAIALVIAGSVFLPQLAESKANEAVAVALRPISAQVASAQDRAWLAERNSKMTDENLRILQADLASRGIKVRLSAHEEKP
jgi:hypothetical protein